MLIILRTPTTGLTVRTASTLGHCTVYCDIYHLPRRQEDLNRRTYISTGAAVLAGLAGCVGSFTRGEASELVEQTFDPMAVSEPRVLNAIGDVTVVGRETDIVAAGVLKRSTKGTRGLEDIDV